jgi:uncharacterized protein
MESKMKILLIGATGMIGSRVLAEAVARGHEVTAAARSADKVAAGKGVTAVAVNAADAARLTDLARDADVIVAATSPRSTGDAMAEAAAAATGVMAAAAATGTRLIHVGGAGSLQFADGKPVIDTVPEMYQTESRALIAVRDGLLTSNLDWTFFCPPFVIEPGTRTGVYRAGGNVILFDADGTSRISAEDFAVAMLDEIESPAHRMSLMTAAY